MKTLHCTKFFTFSKLNAKIGPHYWISMHVTRDHLNQFADRWDNKEFGSSIYKKTDKIFTVEVTDEFYDEVNLRSSNVFLNPLIREQIFPNMTIKEFLDRELPIQDDFIASLI